MRLCALFLVLMFGALVTLRECMKFADGRGLFFYMSPEHGDIIILGVSGAIMLLMAIAQVVAVFRNKK